MKEISENAAAEFRRVIGIMGEDVNLDEITRKIRDRISAPAVETLSENELIEALRRTRLRADERSMVNRAKMGELPLHLSR